MHADATAQADVHERRGLVDMPAARGDEPNGQFARGRAIRAPSLLPPKAVRRPVAPEISCSRYEQVGHTGSQQIGRERSEGAPETGLPGVGG